MSNYTSIMPKFAIVQSGNPFVMNAAANASKAPQLQGQSDFQLNKGPNPAAPSLFNNSWLC